MRIGPVALLACALLAAPAPARPLDNSVSRVENRTVQAWKLGMGAWVAGMIRIREPGGSTELASLKKEGEAYFLMPGKAVDIEILPTRNCLALQVTFSMPAGPGASASVFISQGNPGDPHTLNINPSTAVHVERAFYGQPRRGAFVHID
jgi:hypothetical protein